MIMSPSRWSKILSSELFRSCMVVIANAEKTRRFCRHGLEHSLDTARVMYIICLEQQFPFPMDTVYAAGLLHDIGRAVQYRCGTAHEIAGIDLIERILTECSYTRSEIEEISDAIVRHNESKQSSEVHTLGDLLRLADHKVRPCMLCMERHACYWLESEKNQWLRY